jgi:glycosyltransferase involved in cell wall biosynthesis
MRILQLVDTLNVGGLEKVAVNLANALSEEGLYSCLVSSRLEGPLKASIKPDVCFKCLNKNSALDFKAVWRLKQFIKAHQITIIHAHGSSYFTAVLVKLVCPSIKIIWHDHLGARKEQSWLNLWVLKLCSLLFNQIITVNKALESWSQRDLYCRRVTTINNFIPNNSNVLNDFQLPGKDGKRIICVANLRPVKNHLLLLRSFLLLRQDHPDWTLHLVGSYQNDAYYESVKKFIEQNKLQSHVFIYGLLDEVLSVLKQCDIGVLSSHHEGLPLALLEYGMAGLGVVCTNVGDIQQLIQHGKTGLLVVPDDENAMASNLKKMINSESLMHEMGVALKKVVMASYSKSVVLKQIMSTYSKVIHA